MPKMSLNPDLAKQGGGGVEAGNYRVKTAKYQNIKTDYRPNQLYLVLELTQLDASFQPVREAEEQDLRLSFGQESLKHYRPAVARDANDQEPVAQTDAIDAEGNTISPLDAEPFNKSTAAMVFMESLTKQGFPKDVLNQGFAPAFVGLEFTLASYSPKECNDKFATRLNTKPVKDKDDPNKTVDITYKVATKWQNPTYLGGGASTASSTAAQPSTGAPATPAASTETADELFTTVIKVVAARKKGSEVKSQSALFGFVTNEFTKHTPKLPTAKLAEVQNMTKDGKKVALALQAAGVPVEIDDESGEPKEVTYPISIPA